jgi:hypothetical protein
MSLGPETPDGDPRTASIEFINVHLSVATDAIAFAGMASGDFEIPVTLVLVELRRRQPSLEQSARFFLGVSAPGAILIAPPSFLEPGDQRA